MRRDLHLSRTMLEENTGKPVQVLSYPYGLYTQESEAISKELGFSVTLTTQMQPARLRRGDPDSLRLMGRYSIDDCTPQQLLEKIQA